MAVSVFFSFSHCLCGVVSQDSRINRICTGQQGTSYKAISTCELWKSHPECPGLEAPRLLIRALVQCGMLMWSIAFRDLFVVLFALDLG